MTVTNSTTSEVLTEISLVVTPDQQLYALVDPEQHAERKAILMRFAGDLALDDQNGHAGTETRWGSLDPTADPGLYLKVRVNSDGLLDAGDLESKINQKLASYFAVREASSYEIPADASSLQVDQFMFDEVYYYSEGMVKWCRAIGTVAWFRDDGTALSRWTMVNRPGEPQITADVQVGIRFQMIG